MTDATPQPFDPYRRWLGITPAEQPADHYRMLGLARFEADADVIESGADRQMAHVQRHQTGPNSADSQRVLNELATARVVLLNPAKKAAYDEALRAKIAATVIPAVVNPATVNPKTPSGAVVAPAADVNELAFVRQSPAASRPTASRGRTAKRKQAAGGVGGMMMYVVPIVLCAIAGVGWLVWNRNAPAPDVAAVANLERLATPPAAPPTAPPKPDSEAKAANALAAPSAPIASVPAADSGKSESVASPNKPQSSNKPQSPAEPAPPSPGSSPGRRAKDAFDVSGNEGDPRWWDVLSSTRDAGLTDQNPQFKNLTLNCNPQGAVHARSMLAIIPPKEYVLRAAVTRADAAAEVDFGLTSGSSRFVLIVDGWGGSCTSIQRIDGQSGEVSDRAHHGVVIEPGRECELTVVVRQSGVALFCNGQRVFTWSEGIDRLGASGALETPGEKELFLGGLGGAYVMRRLRLRSLSGESPTFVRDKPIVMAPANPPQPGMVANAPSVLAAGVQPTAMLPTSPAGATPALPKASDSEPIAPLKTLQEAGEEPFCLALSTDSRFAAWGGRTSNVMMDVRSGAKIAGPAGNAASVHRVAFSPDAKQVLFLGPGFLTAWNRSTHESRQFAALPSGGTYQTSALSSDGRYYVSLEPSNRAASVIDTATGNLLLRFDNLPGSPSGSALSPHGRYLALNGYITQQVVGGTMTTGQFLKIYDLKSRREIPADVKLGRGAENFAISDDGKIALNQYLNQFLNTAPLRIFDLAANKYEEPISVQADGRVIVLAFTQDSKRLLRGGADGSLRLWDVATHECAAQFSGHAAAVIQIATSSDGRLMASGDARGVVYLWRLSETPRFASRDFATKSPPPSDEEQKKLLATLKEAFSDDYAKARKPREKAALAEKLFAQAASASSPTEKYVLLAEARDFARAAGEPALFFRAIESLGHIFSIDVVEQVAADVDAIGKLSLMPQARADLAEGLLPLVDQALSEDKYDVANKLLLAAALNARKTKNRELQKTIAARQADVKEQGQHAAIVKTARETLEKGDDPAASLTVGKFHCLTKNDWPAGLPFLAKSSDSALQAAANLEIADPKSASDQAAVADAWHAIGEGTTGREKAKYLAHAAVWYHNALPRLDGLAALKAKKRIAESTELEDK